MQANQTYRRKRDSAVISGYLCSAYTQTNVLAVELLAFQSPRPICFVWPLCTTEGLTCSSPELTVIFQERIVTL